MPLLTIEKLEVGYQRRAILPAFSFEVLPQQRWAIIGPNGGGKSSFVRTILGLQTAVSGGSEWAQDIALSYIAQRSLEDRSFPVSVREFVTGGIERNYSFLNPLITFKTKTQKVVQTAMELTDTTRLARHLLGELSEGQMQRAKIARALASEPDVLILDEPTSAMDVNRQEEIFALLSRLASEGVTTLTVSHHMLAIGEGASHILLLDKDHQLVLAGPKEEVIESEAYQGLYGWLHRRTGVAG